MEGTRQAVDTVMSVRGFQRLRAGRALLGTGLQPPNSINPNSAGPMSRMTTASSDTWLRQFRIWLDDPGYRDQKPDRSGGAAATETTGLTQP